MWTTFLWNTSASSAFEALALKISARAHVGASTEAAALKICARAHVGASTEAAALVSSIAAQSTVNRQLRKDSLKIRAS